MNPHWRKYWSELLYYSRPLPLGPLIALLPFLLNLQYWREHEGLWVGFYSTLIYGTAVGVTIALLFAAVYAGLTWIRIKTGKFYHPPVFVHILIGSFGAITGMWLMSLVESFRRGKPVQYPPFLPVLIFSGMIATAFTLYFAYKRTREESLAFRAEAAEARYHTLENQMRPHFLFNALNSLAELIESGQENAAETAYKLSDLYRQILANSGLKTARLDSELEITTAYLELERLRFGNRLEFEIRTPENGGEIFLPSLMLQTLVENAVKHGIAPSVEGGQVAIEISREGDNGYRLNVANTGAPFTNQSNNGTGLANTRARLDLLYGNRHGFDVRSDERGRTVASFRFTGEKID